MLIEDIFQPVEELSFCPAENCDNEKNIYVPKNYLSFHVCYFFSRMWKIVEMTENMSKTVVPLTLLF